MSPTAAQNKIISKGKKKTVEAKFYISEVVVETRALLKIDLQLHESVVGGSQPFEHLLTLHGSSSGTALFFAKLCIHSLECKTIFFSQHLRKNYYVLLEFLQSATLVW
jgi:hypothetical protein